MATAEGGYEDERFESTVPDNLHCAICLNVLKQPMQCTRNEHFFCRPCITRHLGNTPKCPTCIEPLTLRTLRPARFVKDLVSQLIIRCDYVGRGCEEMVRVEMLEEHVENCAFSPVPCSNDGCEVIMNRRDQLHHETNECNFRQGKCKVCGENVPYERRKLHCYVTKNEMKEIKDEISNLKEMNQVILNYVSDMKEQFDQTKQQINDINRQMNNLESEALQMKQKTKASHGLLHASAEEEWKVRNDIIIAGGAGGGFADIAVPSSVEVYNWPTRQWTLLPEMTSERYRSSSFVYQQQMFVCGGGWSDSMEVLKLTEENGRWKKFPGKLPQKTWGHSSVVYEDNLFIFGGASDSSKVFNDIYKVCLVPPYSCELVCHMPKPRLGHGAQCFGSKVFIVGGTTTGDLYGGCVNSVLVFDIRTNCCRTISTLPYHVYNMATVAWKDNIVIIGGQNKEREELNTVMCYNVKNAKVKMLPPMKYKRACCTAVVTGNVMVVMGGGDENDKYLSSVECFNFDLYKWEELPPMNKERWGASAIVNVFCK